MNSGITEFIPEQGLNNGATATLFKLVHCIGGNDTMNNALSNVKLPDGSKVIVSSQKDVEYLAAIYDKGDNSVFGGSDIKKILLAIEFTPEQLSKAECSIGITTDQIAN